MRSDRVDATTVHRTAEIDLLPNRVRRYRLACPKGYAPTRPRHGIGWFTVSPPSAALAGRVDDAPARMSNGRGIEVRVTTRGIPRKTARLQMGVDCRASS
jgi:hypothetical protein